MFWVGATTCAEVDCGVGIWAGLACFDLTRLANNGFIRRTVQLPRRNGKVCAAVTGLPVSHERLAANAARKAGLSWSLLHCHCQPQQRSTAMPSRLHDPTAAHQHTVGAHSPL